MDPDSRPSCNRLVDIFFLFFNRPMRLGARDVECRLLAFGPRSGRKQDNINLPIINVKNRRTRRFDDALPEFGPGMLVFLF